MFGPPKPVNSGFDSGPGLLLKNSDKEVCGFAKDLVSSIGSDLMLLQRTVEKVTIELSGKALLNLRSDNCKN